MIDLEIEKRLAMLAARDVAKADPQMRSQDFSTTTGMAVWNYGFTKGWLAAKRDAAEYTEIELVAALSADKSTGDTK